MRRRGPRPLMLHLALSQISNGGSPNWSGAFPTAAADPALLAGVAAYRRHPYNRDLPDPPVLWSEGESRLLDYGGNGTPVLFVPSLVNRAYVLDLRQDGSAMRFLAGSGVRPLLLDWGWPGPVERTFTLTDYVAGRLAAAVAAVGAPVVLAGYCMGGLLALALAQLRPELVRALALLATPWDFHAPSPAPALRFAAALPWLDPVLTATGTLPVDTVQALFASLDPALVPAKYRAFADVPADSDRARQFVALEDWLNDGVPLAAPVARECIASWYGANSTVAGRWRVAGVPVDPSRIHVPAFVAIPNRDRIVPVDSACPLATALPRAVVHAAGAGHIGMVAGRRAKEELWLPLLGWLRDYDGVP